MKNILLIATGGTIASRGTESGLTPQISSREILEYVPSVAHLCHISHIQLFNLDSTNILPVHWEAMVNTIRDNYEKSICILTKNRFDFLCFCTNSITRECEQNMNNP